jgi:DNA-directed RNA polymerase subunit beta'
MGQLKEIPFYNQVLDKSTIKQLIGRLVAHFGSIYTAYILDKLKELGFEYATQAGISLGIDDLLIAPSKKWLIQDAEHQEQASQNHYNYGNLHAVEKLRQLIETWHTTSEYLKQEMNPNFKITDPLNPVHMMAYSGARGTSSQVHQLVGMRGLMSDPQGQIIDLPIQSNFREGLSLAEYIISCYGARKGVVDTAIRTSDSGYLTRRLVDVAQHIVVRKTDCRTTKCISIKPCVEELAINIYVQQKLIGRVLADNIKKNYRCIASRNQDVSVDLAIRLVSSNLKSIWVRSPLTCESTRWICQMCYGWSIGYRNLIDIGEAVGIIAAQSIGEPGTQLTLRTFHTGGVFTGDIAQQIRSPLNGIIKFDDSKIRSVRNRYGQPAFISLDNIEIQVQGKDRHKIFIPHQSFLFVKNNQKVQAKQVIAEIASTLHQSKEEINKDIHSELEGEVFWSNKYNKINSKHGRITNNNGMIINHDNEYNIKCLKNSNKKNIFNINSIKYSRQKTNWSISNTGHVWILSGQVYKFHNIHNIFYKQQDKVSKNVIIAQKELLVHCEGIYNNNKINSKSFFLTKQNKLNDSNIYDQRKKKLVSHNYLNVLIYGFTIFKDKRNLINRNSFYSLQISLFHKKTKTKICFCLEAKNHCKVKDNDSLATMHNPLYKIHTAGMVKYSLNLLESQVTKNTKNYKIHKKKETFYDDKIEIKLGQSLFWVPEEIYEIYKPFSFINVKHGEIIKRGTNICENIQCRSSGLVQIHKLNRNHYEISVKRGSVYLIKDIQSGLEKDSMLIPPGEKILDDYITKKWIYLQYIRNHKGDSFLFATPAKEYKLDSQTDLKIFFSLKALYIKKNFDITFFHYSPYQDGQKIKKNTGAQLISTSLIFKLKAQNLLQQAEVTWTKVRFYKKNSYYLQISLIEKSLSNHDLSNLNNFSFSINNNRTMNELLLKDPIFQTSISTENFGCVRTLSRKRRENETSFMLLSSLDQLECPLSSKPSFYFLPFTFIFYKKLGLLGYIYNKNLGMNSFYKTFYSFQEKNHLIFEFYKQKKFSHSFFINWYIIDEYTQIFPFWGSLNRFFKDAKNINSTICFPVPKSLYSFNLGRLLSKVEITKLVASETKLGQVISICQDKLIIRMGKPYLVTHGAVIHPPNGEAINEGDTLITLTYERLKAGDIIQGLPKIEQLLEARRENIVELILNQYFIDCSNLLTRQLGISLGLTWGFQFSAWISMERSKLDLVLEIQKVYRSQGVYISDKHIEIIVRQMTSKVIILGDGMTDGFLPGELVEIPRARKTNRALKSIMFYKPTLVGITRASLNTRSFISEASFQETTRVLTKAAIKGRIDWLKGLKENVILGRLIPAGTGSPEIILQKLLILEKTEELIKRNKQKYKIWILNSLLSSNQFLDKYHLYSYSINTFYSILKEEMLNSFSFEKNQQVNIVQFNNTISNKISVHKNKNNLSTKIEKIVNPFQRIERFSSKLTFQNITFLGIIKLSKINLSYPKSSFK